MSTYNPDAFNRRGALLLLAIAGGPDDRELTTEFNTFFYPLVLRYVRKRHRSLGAEVRQLTGRPAFVPELDQQDIEEAAHATAWLALERSRASAARFDPACGTAIGWVLRAAALAYVDVARELARGSRRSVLRVLMESEELERTLDELRQEDDPAEIVAGRAAVEAAFAQLSEHERQALILKIRKYSYEESAEIVFHDRTATKRIDHLLQGARCKVAAYWDELQATGTSSGLDFPSATDDKELG